MKAAERAVREGRLDDALRMAEQPDIAGHARSAPLLKSLAEAFLSRARDHYRAERFTEALIDLGKAERCGGDPDAIVKLREQVMTVAQEVARQEADRRRRVEEARRCVDGGSLAAGKRMLQSFAESDDDLLHIRKEILDRERRCAELLAQAERHFGERQYALAVDHLLRACRLDAHNERGLRLDSQISDAVLKQATAAFEAGRIRQAQADLEMLQTVGRHAAGRAELEEMLSQALAAAGALAAGAFDDAERRVRRLQTLAPKTAWVKRAVDQLRRLDEAYLALRGGPLGDVDAGKTARGGTPAGLDETVAMAHPRHGGPRESALPRALLLLVDGGGSYLLHRGERITVGRAATNQPADVPIFSDLSEHHADIARVEEDYFLLSGHDVEVGGKRTRHQLLRDGDRVVLARRAKFTLRIPNRKSASARLDLSDSTRMPNDVRSIVLFKQTAMIGRGPGAHVTCHSAARDLVLFERGGQLFVRGHGGGAAQVVDLGRPVEVEGVSFVVQPWSVPTGGLTGRV